MKAPTRSCGTCGRAFPIVDLYVLPEKMGFACVACLPLICARTLWRTPEVRR